MRAFTRFTALCGFVLAMGILAAAPGAASQRAPATGANPGVALWMRNGADWGIAGGDRVRLDGSATLQMRVRDTRELLLVVTGSDPRSNVYVDVCIPVDTFDVTGSPVWAAAESEHLDCAAYSAYVPAVGAAAEGSPRDPLRVRALSEGTFAFRYRIVTAAAPPARGEFRVIVVR